jgi:hypothetical protein
VTSEPKPHIQKLLTARLLGGGHVESHVAVFWVDSQIGVVERLTAATAAGPQRTAEASRFGVFGTIVDTNFTVTMVILVVVFTVYWVVLVFFHETTLVSVVI